MTSAPLITFVGAMDWEPNVDGVEYFCTEVWPSIKAEVPEARFRIVGRNPDRRVQKWASNSINDGGSIEVTGRVPSIVEHLRQSAVVIVPLRIGGGTRLKIYEAMATGKAVVSYHRRRRRIWMFITAATLFSPTIRVRSRRRSSCSCAIRNCGVDTKKPPSRLPPATTGRRSVSASAKSCSR